MKFALYMVVPVHHQTNPADWGRKWFRRYIPNSLQPAWTDDFDRAMQMDVGQAVETYKQCDSLGRVLGLVPIE